MFGRQRRAGGSSIECGWEQAARAREQTKFSSRVSAAGSNDLSALINCRSPIRTSAELCDACASMIRGPQHARGSEIDRRQNLTVSLRR